ncbi:hypothetical protein [Gordonia caeni]|uniref:hypothetical protein n=1 Tax=Gordonia caeni TaxID=1007097 RepID=UPI0031D4677C
MNGRPRTPALLVAIGATTAVLAGCGSTDSTGPSTSASPSTTVTVATTSQPSVTTTSVAVAPSTDGFGSGFAGRAGDARNGSDWNIKIPRLVSGEPRVRDAFNTAMENDADRLIADAKDADQAVTITNGELMPEEASRVVIAKTTLSGAMITVGAVEGAAYPVQTVDTVVVEAGAGRQLSLDDIFTDPAAARQTLAALAPAADPTGRLQDAPVPADTLQQWIALDEGLHLYVPVIHALGDFVPVTVAWNDLVDQLNATGKILFSP